MRPAKQKFNTKISDINPNVSFEEMLEKSDSTVPAEVPHVSQIEVEKLPKTIQEKMIPLSQIDDYIEKKFSELKKTLPAQEVQPIRYEVAPKKVEAIDDLPEFARWEEKDRIYVLCTGYSSLSQGIKDRHKKNSPLMYKGRSLRYSTSQASFFMDKQVGDVLLSYLSIEEGKLFIPKENTHLQKFLAIHPDNGVIFKEHNPKEVSRKEYDAQLLKTDAFILMKQLDTATVISIAMLMCHGYNESLDLITVKRDLYNEIELNPKLFIKLASDPNLKLKTIGKTAVYRGYLKYANFRFFDENDQVILEVGRNENEYESLASYFGTSEGRNLYEYLLQKIEN
jgi:hypothetical protein